VRISAANLWRLANALQVDVSFFFDGLAEPTRLRASEKERSVARSWA
jgi:transcriptional regulator with XRE-family HTH domain